MMKRITKQQLGEIELKLVERDRQIMAMMRLLRFMRTSQVMRLFFISYATTGAALTGTKRNLNRLMRLGLITHFARRIGGIQHGSSEFIWYLTEAGVKLLDLGKETEGKRIRAMEPSPAFLRHTLAVAECYVQFTEICRMAHDMKLNAIAVEPECWRSYQKDGKAQSLRPDLYAETVSGRFEDRWFIEMDLDTESVNDIVEKCRRYQHYYQTEKEQRASGVFPIVLWIVPSQERKDKIIDSIRFNFGKRYPHINLVITPGELWTTLLEGAKKEDLC